MTGDGKSARASSCPSSTRRALATDSSWGCARNRWAHWRKDSFFAVKGVTVPAAVSVFPEELYEAPRSWAERAYPKLIHYNRLPEGGHFAACEQPDLLVHEMRAGFRTLH